MLNKNNHDKPHQHYVSPFRWSIRPKNLFWFRRDHTRTVRKMSEKLDWSRPLNGETTTTIWRGLKYEGEVKTWRRTTKSCSKLNKQNPKFSARHASSLSSRPKPGPSCQCRVEKPILSRIKFYFRQFWMNVKWAWALNMIRLKIRRSSLVCSARHAASNSRKTYCWDPILGSVPDRSEECRYENVCFSDLTSHLIGGCSGSGFFFGVLGCCIVCVLAWKSKIGVDFSCCCCFTSEQLLSHTQPPEDRKEKISNILNQSDGEHQGRQIRWFFGFRVDRFWVGWCLSSKSEIFNYAKIVCNIYHKY